ncbi:unnamed protein product [Closterium sp. NIES-53]
MPLSLSSLALLLACRYVAPEYVRTGKITQAVDVFAFGVVLLELITGHIPFHPSRTPAYLFAWVSEGED